MRWYCNYQQFRGLFYFMFKYKDYNFQVGEFGHPKSQGVYILFVSNYITQKSQILYIGSSKNLSKRINDPSHFYRLSLEVLSNEYFVYSMSCVIDNYKEIEKEMIKYFKPPLNIQHNV